MKCQNVDLVVMYKIKRKNLAVDPHISHKPIGDESVQQTAERLTNHVDVGNDFNKYSFSTNEVILNTIKNTIRKED